MRRALQHGIVYFVRAGDSGPIKIGFTSCDIAVRLHALRIKHGDHLRVLLTVEGSRQDERKIHGELAEQSLSGEWFRPSAEVDAIIDAVMLIGRLPDYLKGAPFAPRATASKSMRKSRTPAETIEIGRRISDGWKARRQTTQPLKNQAEFSLARMIAEASSFAVRPASSQVGGREGRSVQGQPCFRRGGRQPSFHARIPAMGAAR